MTEYPKRIVSGGQTGADRGGLAAAITLGIPHGGWCPKGRRAEDGQVPDRYALRESANANYQARTRRNVLDSDGTVVFTQGRLAGGGLLTARIAREAGRPCLHLDFRRLGGEHTAAVAQFRAWVLAHRIETLNVAGSRESKARGIQKAVEAFLLVALGGAEPAAVAPRVSELAAEGGEPPYRARDLTPARTVGRGNHPSESATSRRRRSKRTIGSGLASYATAQARCSRAVALGAHEFGPSTVTSRANSALMARDDELDGDAPLCLDSNDEARHAEATFPGVAYLTPAELRIYARDDKAGRSHAEALAAARQPARSSA